MEAAPFLLAQKTMRNVKMFRTQPNFSSTPVEHAAYCDNCFTVSNSHCDYCGV